ncbi:MAG: PEP-CTERM sorting domain-containing protein [Verrucomicrobiota bacterium]
MNGSQLDFSILPPVPEPSTWVAMTALIVTGGTMAMRRRSRQATGIL